MPNLRSALIRSLGGLLLGAELFGQGQFAGAEYFANACGVVEQRKIIPRYRLSLPALREEAQSFTNLVRNTGRVGILLMATTANDLSLISHKADLGPSSPCSGEQPDLQNCLAQMRNTPPTGPVARVLTKSGAAILSVYSDGTLQQSLLATTHTPADLEVNGSVYRITHIHASAVRSLRKGITENCISTFYIQSDSVSFQGAMSVVDTLKHLVESGDLQINFRKDGMFLVDSSFPEVNPFAFRHESLTSLGYTVGAEIRCSVSATAVRCSGQNFSP